MEEKNILDPLSAQEEDTSSKLNNEKKPETGLPEERDNNKSEGTSPDKTRSSRAEAQRPPGSSDGKTMPSRAEADNSSGTVSPTEDAPAGRGNTGGNGTGAGPAGTNGTSAGPAGTNGTSAGPAGTNGTSAGPAKTNGTSAGSAKTAAAAGTIAADAAGKPVTGNKPETTAAAGTAGKTAAGDKPGTGAAAGTAGKPVTGDKPETTAAAETAGKPAAADKPGTGPRTDRTGQARTGGGGKQGSGEIENTLVQVRSEKKKPLSKKTAKEAPSYEEKLIRHKARLYRRTLITVSLITALLMAVIILWMHRGYKKAELVRVSSFTVEDGAEFVGLGKNIIRYSGNGAVCMDRRGNTRWHVSYKMQQPIISISGDVIAIANRSGYNVYVMNTKGLLGTIETMFPIHSITASESGEVAVVMNDARATWIRLYTPEGKEIAYIIQTMPENGYPISATVSADGETLCLSSVQLSSAAVKSNISFYNFGKAGQKKADHRVDRYDFIDEVVPYVGYMDDETCAGISDKRLILFQKTLLGKSGSSSILFSENLQGVFSGENLIGLLFNNTSDGEQYRLDVYNRRGRKAGSVKFTMQYKEIKISGDKIYINNDQECQIFDLSGRCIFKGDLGRTISALIPGTRLNDLLVVTGGEIDSVRLH